MTTTQFSIQQGWNGPWNQYRGSGPWQPPSPAPVHFHDVNNSKPSLSFYVITITNRETSQSGTLYMYICQCMLPLQRGKKFLLVLHPRIKIISKKVFSYTHTQRSQLTHMLYREQPPFFFLFLFYLGLSVCMKEIWDIWHLALLTDTQTMKLTSIAPKQCTRVCAAQKLLDGDKTLQIHR